jgi:hypothetical protein
MFTIKYIFEVKIIYTVNFIISISQMRILINNFDNDILYLIYEKNNFIKKN